jgi:chromosome segregation ATPase
MLNDTESKVAGLQEHLKTEKKLHVDAESSVSALQESVSTAAENLKSVKTSDEEEKTALLKHAEEAENRLKPITDELSSLKRYITDMTQAIFGK